MSAIENGRAVLPDVQSLQARLEEMTAPLRAELDQVEAAVEEAEATIGSLKEHRRRLKTIIRAMEGGSLGGRPNKKQAPARPKVVTTEEQRERFLACLRNAKRPVSIVNIVRDGHLSPQHGKALLEELLEQGVVRDCGRSEERMPSNPTKRSTARLYSLFPEHV